MSQKFDWAMGQRLSRISRAFARAGDTRAPRTYDIPIVFPALANGAQTSNAQIAGAPQEFPWLWYAISATTRAGIGSPGVVTNYLVKPIMAESRRMMCRGISSVAGSGDDDGWIPIGNIAGREGEMQALLPYPVLLGPSEQILWYARNVSAPTKTVSLVLHGFAMVPMHPEAPAR